MKTKLFPVFVIAAGLITLGARAQVATPSTPASAGDPTAVPQASQMVYAPRLPSATELTNVAAAQGLSIDKIVQTSSQMTVVYRLANGQTNTVAYVLLPAAGSVPGTVVATVATTASPAPQVVYSAPAAAPRVVYYSVPAPAYYYDPFYSPAYYSPWYAPVAFSVGWGIGFHGDGYHHGGGEHGGFHGHH